MSTTDYDDSDPNLIENWVDRFLEGWVAPDLPPGDPDDFIMIVSENDDDAERGTAGRTAAVAPPW